jgi:hypothetical protein
VIASPDCAVEWVLVDPALAEQWLTRNEGNRRVFSTRVAFYAGQMKAGLWRDDNPDPVVFDTNERLANGQHRLWAILESGHSARLLVLRGADPQLRHVLDTGASRSASDLLQITHEIAAHRAVRYAAAVRGLTAWERFPKRGPAEHAGTRLSNQEVMALLPRYERAFERLLPVAGAITKAKVRGGEALWLTLLVRFDELDPEAAADFGDRVATGANLPERSPVLALRSRLLMERRVPEPTHRLLVARLIVYAWNAWREGRPLAKVQAQTDYAGKSIDFPTPV